MNPEPNCSSASIIFEFNPRKRFVGCRIISIHLALCERCQTFTYHVGINTGTPVSLALLKQDESELTLGAFVLRNNSIEHHI